MKRINILHLIYSLEMGGAEKVIYQYVDVLKKDAEGKLLASAYDAVDWEKYYLHDIHVTVAEQMIDHILQHAPEGTQEEKGPKDQGANSDR